MNNNYKGNRWYKCDLHLHTPASECFEDKSITPQQFLDVVIENDIKCIAITDHNTAGWIDNIRDVAKEKDIVVFPGVEVTCSDSKVHLLILFEIDYPKIKIEDFLVKINIDRELFGTTDAHSNKSISEVAKVANEVGAVVIPAHIDDYNGVGIVSSQARREFLNLENINVVQMVNEELISNTNNLNNKEIQESLLKKYNNNISATDIKKFIACDKELEDLGKGILTFSDNPNAEGESKHGVWGIGKQYSYIKMSENPTLESLRQAFLFPQYRIKNCFEEKKSKIRMPQLWIKKINIKDIELLGKEALEVVFNPQLTTIIGGRGSGKSTVVRFLTAAFAKSRIRDLDEIYKEFISFYQVKNKESGVLKESTVITIEVVKNNVLYKIILKDFKTGDIYKVVISKYNSETNDFEEITGILPDDIFGVDIYNQKQIYELAKNTNSLRDKIDSLIDGIEDKKAEASNLIVDYKKQYANIVEIKEKIKNKKKVELELKDIQEKIDTYKSSGINDIIEKFKFLESQRVFMLKQEKELQDKQKELDNIVSGFELESIEESYLEGEYKEELLELINKKNLEYKGLIKVFEDVSKKIGILRDKYTEEIKSSGWYISYSEVKKEYQDRLVLLKDKGVDIEEINILIAALEKKNKELDAIEKYEKVLADECEALVKTREKYILMRDEISNLRDVYSNNLLKDTSIKLKVKKFRNTEHFEAKFREIIQKKQSFDEDINKIVEECANGNIVKNIDKLADKLKNINSSGENDSAYSAKFNNVIKGLNNEQIAEISMFIPEDYIEIEYKLSGSNVYKSLKNASAGQRTSAILTFILSDGDTPLILDQPEDDLDNHLIYDLVVERLRICKEKRQIIVVTHNANIPVNGDAELIVAMDSNSRYLKVYKSGGVEEDELRTEICNVMEGGEKAFLMRANRYRIER
ncbi:TrlF family AAA-like ATPase [Clostridium celatum]|uniref:TrlF family AAA-like ATPase n=1 Tax=Clostridium celatum TaxID=36834 RepID=UPI00319D8A80